MTSLPREVRPVRIYHAEPDHRICGHRSIEVVMPLPLVGECVTFHDRETKTDRKYVVWEIGGVVDVDSMGGEATYTTVARVKDFVEPKRAKGAGKR